MSFYGNLIREDLQVVDEEGIIVCENVKELVDLIKNWKTSNEVHKEKEFKSTSLSNSEYEEIKKYVETIRKEDVKYGDYKRAFNKLCSFCHIVPTGVIITKCELKKGKENNHSLYVKYSENTKKITLPDSVKLYHLSKVAGIKKLIPQFKGKSAKGYLYDKPRIYFTIRKNMPKFLADYKVHEKVHKYMCKENIKDVYVDPLVWSNVQGAVYVEINKPVDVEEMGIPDKNDNKVDDNVEKETVNKENFIIIEDGLNLVEI